MIYLDSCALVKLLVTEPETPALVAFLSAHAAYPHVTTTLARTEVTRVVRRAAPKDSQLHAAAVELVDQLDQVELERPLLDQAGIVADPYVRTLDAIHLAAALHLAEALTAFVTYDHRLAAAARDAGLPVRTPT
ncbi:type II toxin-antitoxin system VapC family toxin [Frankia sp. Cas4]|uniref:type II toxin-antitoxin system VapC family toxin n=1 Tax=Frankia sp. Cas4 TaxID=3073927 RepID=UPI002AD56253|nr:type II toxin-antitoxin system VapC family toxin [Frankia sp. Cas4]